MTKFTDQRFDDGEFLTASKLNQQYDNVNLIRGTHASAQAPYNPSVGVYWLDTSTLPWVLKQYDGSAWVSIIQINYITNKASIAESSLPAGTVASGTVLGSYVASGAITDLIMQDSILTDSAKIASGSIVDHKIKNSSITAAMVDSGAVLKKNIKAEEISEDECNYALGSISGTSSNVSISLNQFAFAPCVQRTSGSAEMEWHCRTGTADASTPGMQLKSSSSVGYIVQYRYFAT